MNAETHRIEIFKLGRHTAVNGVVVDFGEAEAKGLIDGYDAETSPAPIVVGHPALDAPAYGWVSGLSMDGDRVVAEIADVEPAFAELQRAGRYRKVSAELYPPAHKSSPNPAAWYLKHVGFLGAAAPAIKGLKIAKFAAGAEGVVTIESPEEFYMAVEEEKKAAAFAEAETKLKTDRDALEAEKTAFAKARAEARHADHVSFAEGLVAAAKLPAEAKPLVVGCLDALTGAAAGDTVVSFGEAGELTPAAALRKLLDAAKPMVAFGEFAGKGEEPTDASDSEAVAREALAFAEEQRGKGIIVNAADAVRHVLKKGI